MLVNWLPSMTAADISEKNVNKSSWVWFLTSSTVGLSIQPNIGSTSRYAAGKETCDIDRWLGVDSEWQANYLFHSSLGDSLSILDRLLWKDLTVE